MEAVLVKVPDVPVIVTLATPMAAVLLAVNVNVLVLVVLVGLKEAVTPLGSPDVDKLTLLLKPFRGVTVMVFVPLPACVMVMLLGDVEMKKPGRGPAVGQLLTKFVAFSVPIPVAKSQPVMVPYAGLNELLDVAIVCARAIYVDVALGHVIKNAGASHPIPEGRIAGSAAARAILGSGQLVIDWIRITLTRTHLLIDQGLNASQDRCGEGRPPGAGPRAGIAGARLS